MTWAVDIPSTVRDGEWENRGYFESRREALDKAAEWFGSDGAGRIVIVSECPDDDLIDCEDCVYTHRDYDHCPTHVGGCDGFCDAYEYGPGCREEFRTVKCVHEPDPGSITHVRDDIFDVWCRKCSVGGAFRLGMSEQEVDW